ncbi:L,D-transpeptidase [Sphingomonas sp.]|jgi:lipoprotein-anchoring transpeptidase ErfK/SrfK|uniref:L,D-transpeptidase family protein n=1 Tax=unclassified Sphingomonas TaxID=196159 RepID=UPI000E100919|nr:murein L,D-transpeptidase [Sphingomonas sp. FARSPH]
MFKRSFVAAAALVAIAGATEGRSQSATGQGMTYKPVTVDRSILHVQVILDSLGFGPGVLDGKGGQSLTAALNGFQEAKGLPITGKPDTATLQALYPYRAKRPTTRFVLTREVLAGPYVGPLPKDYAKQAELPTLGYANPMEKLAEMFHTTPAVLIALNSPQTRLKVGDAIVVPNDLPASRNYDPKLPEAWRQTLATLNVDANQPVADHVVVSKSKGVLRVLDKDDKLIAQFSATMGSSHDPLPLGTWTIQGKDYNPVFHYNPALFWDAKKGDKKEMLPAGPNGPVGVVWLDLSKPHYGIHGTPNPELIGRTESHGCIRLTNWDVARLAQMVKPGTKAVFEA